MHVSLPVSSRLPGFKTVVTQTLDVGQLKDAQLKRLRNAATLGYVQGMGYAAEALNRLAKEHRLMGPVVVRSAGTYTYVYHDMFRPPASRAAQQIVDELTALSDVRQKFAEAQGISAKYKSSHMGSGEVALVGWYKDVAPLKKEILTRMKALPEFVENNRRLVEVLESRPSITIFNETR
jgi:hypothetical protein